MFNVISSYTALIMYKQKRIQLFIVRKGKRNHRLVTGTERGKENIFIHRESIFTSASADDLSR